MEINTWQIEELTVHTLPILTDNFVYILAWNEGAILVDPGVDEPVLNYIDEHSLNIKAILNTHFHSDHTDGNKGIKQSSGARLIAPSEDKIDDVDQVVSEDEEIILGPLLIQVIATPGHTLDHVCYYIPDYQLLFSGDLLFVSGCGRVFEGTYEALFRSLQKIKLLPANTNIFCGHDYGQTNLCFGKSVEPSNQAIAERLTNRDFALPTTLEKELATNVFLRCDSCDIRATLDMKDATDLEVFCKLRQMRDNFVI